MGTIVVVDYDSTWPKVFDDLCSHLRPVLGNLANAVEHVGSTAVPGLAAKPIIDISVVVWTAAEVPVAIERLATLGYLHLGNLGIEGREAFKAPDTLPPHHLYVCPNDSRALANHLTLRDYLRSQPEAAKKYGDLKKDLASRFAHDIDRYTDGKTDIIVQMLEAAGFEASELAAADRMNRSRRKV